MSLIQGIGLGLRAPHYSHIESQKPAIPWFEVLADNYFHEDGLPFFHLKKIRKDYPVTLHSVGMSLGSSDPLNFDYLKKLKRLIDLIHPSLISDHLCWTSFGGKYFHELLPLPYTEEVINHVALRIQQVQDFLGQRIMIENVSSYLSFKHSEMTEWEFLQTVADRADCWILLDINNIVVSARNNEFDADTYIKELSTERIQQFHLGGFEDCETHWLDNHGAVVHHSVWELYRKALQKWGTKPTCIERDNNIPSFLDLVDESRQAKEYWDEAR